MLGNLISNRGIRAGLVFFVLIVGGSLLYSWYIHRTRLRWMKLETFSLCGSLKQREGAG